LCLGEDSIYTKHCNAEIMFHVSTLLPHSDKDPQQIERKRHIGNDRVAIVFQDELTPFSPSLIKSKVLHVFIIIQPVKLGNETKKYKVNKIQLVLDKS
jgi:RAP1 GTPase activating protein 1